jgi:hypothetical protein
MPLHVGTHGPCKKGIESLLKQWLKRLLHLLLQFAARRIAGNGLETSLEQKPKLLFRLLL